MKRLNADELIRLFPGWTRAEGFPFALTARRSSHIPQAVVDAMLGEESDVVLVELFIQWAAKKFPYSRVELLRTITGQEGMLWHARIYDPEDARKPLWKTQAATPEAAVWLLLQQHAAAVEDGVTR